MKEHKDIELGEPQLCETCGEKQLYITKDEEGSTYRTCVSLQCTNASLDYIKLLKSKMNK